MPEKKRTIQEILTDALHRIDKMLPNKDVAKPPKGIESRPGFSQPNADGSLPPAKLPSSEEPDDIALQIKELKRKRDFAKNLIPEESWNTPKK
jgi:hypothetical protein